MGNFRLICQTGQHPNEEWVLPPERALLVGRQDGGARTPDIDLTFDRQVSRQHARIWFERDAWWVEDLGSTHGTRVGRRSLAPRESARLEPGADIQVGQTALTLFPPHWYRLRHCDSVVEAAVSHAVDAVLAQTGTRIISRLVVRNPTSRPTGARQLMFSVADWGDGDVRIPPLHPGESSMLKPPRWTFRMGTKSVPRGWRPLTVTCDGEPLRCSQAVGSWILANDEWSLLAEHRAHLAGFVLPTHPAVMEIAWEATAGLEQTASSDTVLRRLHDYFASTWHLDYRLEPMSWAGSPTSDEPPFQRVRLPDVVLADNATKVGSGTCLDLALLFAGLLEAFHLQPLLAIVERRQSRHALVGCWKRRRRNLEPVLVDREMLLTQAIWLDPNACTRDPSQRCNFHEAHLRAADDLKGNLIFAVDVAAARVDGVRPLVI